jgi:hypothetical protein
MRLREFLDQIFKREPARQASSAGGEARSLEPAANRSADRREEAAERREAAIEKRQRQAAERLLENENLTGDLEDDAADPLINWGVDWAKKAAETTAGQDDDQAEQALADQNRAVRQVMRQVSQMVVNSPDLDDETARQALAQISNQAAALVPGFVPPAPDRQDEFIRQLPDLAQEPARMVRSLHALYDQPRESA